MNEYQTWRCIAFSPVEEALKQAMAVCAAWREMVSWKLLTQSLQQIINKMKK